MLFQSWTMEWFTYLNATIIGWSALVYCYREFMKKASDG